MLSIVIKPIVRVTTWLAVAGIIGLSVAQRRPRPNAALIEE